MNNKYLLIIFLFMVVSCDYEKELNPVPTTLISEVTAFENIERIHNQINGLYASFKESGLWGSQYVYFSEARAGNFVSTNLNPTRGGLSYQMGVDASSSDVADIWAQGYQLINGCNLFLERMELNGSDLLDANQYNNYLAEARFLRAITYYYLLQLYAQPFIKDNGASPGLPLRTVSNTSLKDYELKRSSVKEVYDFIIEELNFSEDNLPENYSTSLLNTTRAHKNTVIAMKTNVFIAKGDHKSVILEANKMVPVSPPFVAVNGVPNQIMDDVTSIFEAPYTSLESIFSMPFTPNDVPGTSLGNAYLPDGANAVGLGAAGTGDYYLLETAVISDPNWKLTDKRRNFIFKTQSGVNAGRSWCVKYKMGTPFADYVPVIRYAQVMLNLAEALANEHGVDARSVLLLNAVRQRSDATTTFNPTTKDQLLSLILQERNIEFFGEGMRNIDLVRQLKPIPAKIPSGGSPVPEVKPTDPNYIWPLPTSETLYNHGL